MPERISRLTAYSVLSCLLCLVSIGCGGLEPAGLSGKVEFKGEPIKEGAMRLFPVGETTGDGAGAVIENGSYKIDIEKGLVNGEYRVSITAWKDTKRKIRNEEALEGEPKFIKETIQYLPVTYNQRTKLQLKLEPGKNEKDFKLE